MKGKYYIENCSNMDYCNVYFLNEDIYITGRRDYDYFCSRVDDNKDILVSVLMLKALSLTDLVSEEECSEYEKYLEGRLKHEVELCNKQ